eukprot:10972434-Prorocentrum_lima.AAC.1
MDAQDRNIKINGNTIKRFNSGGDVLYARRLYENAREFKIQARLLMFGNDVPPVNPPDAQETMIPFH